MVRKILCCALLILSVSAAGRASSDQKYRRAAAQAGLWLRSTAIRTDHGVAWAVEPDNPKVLVTNLYSGTSGVVLFFLEHFRATLEDKSLEMATAGADYLLATLPDSAEGVNPGLYTGLAGIGFVLNETFNDSGRPKYRAGVEKVIRLLEESAQPAGAGLEWNGVTDIVGGSAGTGLFLLYAARELESPRLVRIAVRAGDHLVESARSGEVGSKWAMSDSFPRLMPNFSHGTAGVAYFLAGLYQETGQKRFLEAAVQGARYLQSIADGFGDGCLIFHHEPEGEQLYYLSWCHGPAGTARLFHRLHELTGDAVWADWREKLAQGLRGSGIPDRETPGYWNNVSQCCGAAGVAEFFMSLYRVSDDERDLLFATRVVDALLAKATAQDGGLKWIQAEHRVRPGQLAAQTGYMQGAAGIGIALLHLDSLLAKKGRSSIVFPDSPWESPPRQ